MPEEKPLADNRLQPQKHVGQAAKNDKLPVTRVTCPTCNLVLAPDTRFCPNDSTPIKQATARSIPNYEFIKILGSGGMGHVYMAEHVVLKTRVAIKLLKADLIETTAFTRFQKEAQATSRLKHANIVSVYDCGLSAQGEPYMVMDLIDGETVEAMLKKGPLSISASLDIARQICAGMMCAHENGILHRDLKPSNVILQKNQDAPVVKILDFGIAKVLEDSEMGAMKTRTGEVFGTPAYMSPEQVSGEALDQRSDIYSVGCILYEMLTGQPPVIGKSAVDIMYKHVNETPLSLSQVSMGQRFPLRLEKIVARALAKDPQNRYKTMKEMMTSIDNFLAGKSESLEPDDAKNKQNSGGPGWKIILLTILGSVICTLAAVATIISVLRIDEQKPAAAPPPAAKLESVLPILDSEAQATEDNFKFAADLRRVGRVIDQPPLGITDTALIDVRRYVNLTEVGLENCCNITPKGLENLVALPNLQKLNLEATSLGDSAIPVINRMTHLTSLEMTGTPLTDAGVAKLNVELPLVFVQLKSTPVGDGAMEHLAKCKTLHSLMLDNCSNVTDTGVAKLASLQLVSLNLSNNAKITDAITKTLKKIPTLVSFYACGTSISDHTLEALVKSNPNLRVLDVRECAAVSEEAIADFNRKSPKCEVKSNFGRTWGSAVIK